MPSSTLLATMQSRKACNCYIICWLSIYKNFCKWHQAPFMMFWVGPGDEANLPARTTNEPYLPGNDRLRCYRATHCARYHNQPSSATLEQLGDGNDYLKQEDKVLRELFSCPIKSQVGFYLCGWTFFRQHDIWFKFLWYSTDLKICKYM